jgi:hypothetical protein
MSIIKRYTGTFYSRKNVKWTTDIMQDADAAFVAAESLQFPANEPLTIEWGETSKEDVLCGSTATLKILSPGDRTYQDLYTIEPGKIRLDVYRNDELYWSGALDPEFYQEPYSDTSDYEVGLTFSDFGIFDRLKYNMAGMQTFRAVILQALYRAALPYNDINEDYISTQFDKDSAKISMAGVSVRSDNFIDEDGEYSTLKIVIEGMLQPLGLRILQKAGIIYVYDLNGLYNGGSSEKVCWDSDDAEMSTDKVANNVKVTFSPYSNSVLQKDEIDYLGTHADSMTNLTSNCPSDGEYYSYYPDYSNANQADGNWDYHNLSFTIFLSNKATGLAEKMDTAKYFHIQPLLGAEESNGVAYGFYTGGHGDLNSGWPEIKLNNPASRPQALLMRTHQMYVPTLATGDKGKYLIRLTQEMLLDARYNPFSDAGSGNEGGNYDSFKAYFGYVMIPASVTLYSETGTPLCHYVNSDIAHSTGGDANIYGTCGKWVSGAASYGDCWIEYYNTDDRRQDTGVLGWKGNRQAIGVTTKDLYPSFKKMADGQYMKYPDQGGFLEVCIYAGVWAYDFASRATWNDVSEVSADLYKVIRWLLYKAPKVEVVNYNSTFSASESEDVEYSGVINANAKDDIKIDTICGTMKSICPTAKGLIRRNSDNGQVQTLYRAGRTNQAEHLLIGTLYSQFAARHTKLSGTADVLDGGLCVMTDTMQEGKKFLVTSDVQDLGDDHSNMSMTELSPDNYVSTDE